MLPFIHLCLEPQVVAELWLLIQCRMAQGGWHQGTAGTTYYRGGSDSSAWPTWTQVQGAGAAAGETPASGADRDEELGRSQEPASASDHPYWRAQSWESTSWGGGGRYNDDWQWGWWSSGSGTKGDYSDPPAWGGWSSYRLWKKSMIRWNQNTDVPVWRRFEKLSKQLDWDLQGKFEHVPESVLAGPGYLDAVVSILDGLAGEKDASEKRRVVRAALFEGQRKKEETLSQFAVRREQEFAGADRYLSIPSELKAFILEETAGLSRQGVQNLRTLMGGSGDFDKMVGALKTLDVEEEPLTKAKGGMFAGMTGDSEGYAATRVDDDGDASEDSDYEEQVKAFLAEVDDVDEDLAVEMLSAFEKDQAKAPEKRRTWKQNKKRKAAARKDRRVFSRPKLTVGELKERTRCANCGERGHWKAECRKPFRSKEERGKTEGRSQEVGKRAVAFVYLGSDGGHGNGNTFVGWSGGLSGHRTTVKDAIDYTILHKDMGNTGGVMDYLALGAGPAENLKAADPGEDDTSEDTWWSRLVAAIETGGLNFFSLDPGHAILDIGAAQDLVGKEAFDKLNERLRSQGLRVLRLAAKPPAAHGVGGKATPLFQALIPCILAGVPGVVKVTVIEENIPHLISVGLLEATGAAIDMRRNTVVYQELGVSEPMQRLRSGHRVVDIAAWRGGEFPTPPHLQEEFGLTKGAFNLGAKLSGTAVEVYMVAGDGGSQSCRGRQVSFVSECRECGSSCEADGTDAVVGKSNFKTQSLADEKNAVPKPLARSSCEPPRAERFASHGEQCRAQVEGNCDTSVASPGSPREAGGEPTMPTPRRFRCQWGKSIWLLAAMSALSNKDQLCAPPQPAKDQSWESGRVCQRAPAGPAEAGESLWKPSPGGPHCGRGGGDWPRTTTSCRWRWHSATSRCSTAWPRATSR